MTKSLGYLPLDSDSIFIFLVSILGALDTSTIHILPKHRVSDSIVRKVPTKMLNQPFEATFRLKVSIHFAMDMRRQSVMTKSFQIHLPKNQLYVLRVTPKTTIAQVLRQVCEDKSLDEFKYEIQSTGEKEVVNL